MTWAAVFGSGVVAGAVLALIWVYRRNRVPLTPLPQPVQNPQSMTSYFVAQKSNLEQAVRFETFAKTLPSGLIQYGAGPGSHDDLVMALMLAWEGSRFVLTREQRQALQRAYGW